MTGVPNVSFLGQIRARQVSAKVWNNVCNKNNYLKLLLFAIQLYLGIVCKSDKQVIFCIYYGPIKYGMLFQNRSFI